MKNTFIAAVIVAAAALAPAHAAPTLGEGLGQTVQAVLQRPVGTVADIVRGYPGTIGNLAPLSIDLFLIVPSVLRGQPIDPNLRRIVVPLPGPAFLNQNLLNIPDVMRVNVSASGPLVVTVATGGR
jgi:hypothetical protein